jgi:cytochrome b561
MLKNTRETYGTVSKTLHWLIALLIITLVIVGYIMTDMAPADLKWTFYSLHKATGVTVFMLVILRLIWRLQNISPSLPASLPQWQVFLSGFTIALLYMMMFLMPLSGLTFSVMSGHAVSYFGLFTIPALTQGPTSMGSLARTIHVYGAYSLIGLVTLHILGGLYHHFILKDNVLKRMIPKV